MNKNPLFEVLDELVDEERWRKKAKFNGVISDKKLTKNGHLLLIIKKMKNDERVIVVKQKEELFDKADKLKKGDEVYIIGERKVNVVFCDVLKVLDRQKQAKLV